MSFFFFTVSLKYNERHYTNGWTIDATSIKKANTEHQQQLKPDNSPRGKKDCTVLTFRNDGGVGAKILRFLVNRGGDKCLFVFCKCRR